MDKFSSNSSIFFTLKILCYAVSRIIFSDLPSTSVKNENFHANRIVIYIQSNWGDNVKAMYTYVLMKLYMRTYVLIVNMESELS